MARKKVKKAKAKKKAKKGRKPVKRARSRKAQRRGQNSKAAKEARGGLSMKAWLAEKKSQGLTAGPLFPGHPKKRRRLARYMRRNSR